MTLSVGAALLAFLILSRSRRAERRRDSADLAAVKAGKSDSFGSSDGASDGTLKVGSTSRCPFLRSAPCL